MINKKYTVVKDLCNENMGTPSTVGQVVTTIVEVPADTAVVVFDQEGQFCFTSTVRSDVFLTKGGKSRSRDGFGDGIINRIFAFRINGVWYEGNDVYTAEELGITE